MEDEGVRSGKKLWAIARKKVKVIARINAMKRMTLQNYYGVRDDNDFVETTRMNKWCIYPDSKLKGLWDIIIILLMLYTCTVLPFRLAFYDEQDLQWDIVDQIFNYIFAFDILVNMFSAYYDLDNVLVTNNKYILLNYLKTWFIFDLCSVIPFDEILTPQSAQNITEEDFYDETSSSTNINGATAKSKPSYTQLLRLTRLPRLYRLLRVFKLFRLTKLQQGGRSSFISKLIKKFIKLDASIRRMIKIMGASLLFLHLSSCFYFLITKIEDDSITWVTALQLENSDVWTKYIRAFHWALQTLTTVGFGDVPPQTDYEKIYAIFWMGVGSAFFSFMISNLQGAVGDSEKSAKDKLIRLNVLQKQLKIPEYRNFLPIYLVYSLIKKQIESQQTETSRQLIIQQTKPLIKQLPTCLRSSVQLCIYAHIIEKIKFLQDKDIELIMDVIPKIYPLHWTQGDILYSTDEYAEEIYFVAIGEITTRAADGSTISVYKDGDILGVLEAIYDVRRIGTAICSKNTQLFSLDRTTYLQMLWAYPQLLSEVKQQVDKRIREVKPFLEDSSILNRSIFEVMQDYKRKINKIQKVMETLQKSEDNDAVDGDQIEQFLIDNPALDNLFALDENSKDMLAFENAKAMNNIVEHLADVWQKQLIGKIDEMFSQSGLVIQAVQERVEYYQRATRKFGQLKEDLQSQKESIEGLVRR